MHLAADGGAGAGTLVLTAHVAAFVHWAGCLASAANDVLGGEGSPHAAHVQTAQADLPDTGLRHKRRLQKGPHLLCNCADKC